MRAIDPHTIYEAHALQDLLKGFVKIEVLRQFGLIGSPGSGYWGRNVVDSIDNYWDHLARQRDTGKVTLKEDHQNEKPEFFDNRAQKIQNRQIHRSSRNAQPMESQRERFRRQVS